MEQECDGQQIRRSGTHPQAEPQNEMEEDQNQREGNSRARPDAEPRGAGKRTLSHCRR